MELTTYTISYKTKFGTVSAESDNPADLVGAREKLKDLAKQDPNAIVDTATGQTLLHQAITKPLSPTFTNASRIKLVSMLLQRGADITKKDKAGQTALDLAKKSGNPEILAIFDLFSPTKERTEKLIKSLTSLREQLKKLAQQLTTLKK